MVYGGCKRGELLLESVEGFGLDAGAGLVGLELLEVVAELFDELGVAVGVLRGRWLWGRKGMLMSV